MILLITKHIIKTNKYFNKNHKIYNNYINKITAQKKNNFKNKLKNIEKI